MLLRSQKGQGAFEYILMLSGVLLIVVTITFVMQGAIAGANNTLGSQANTFNSTVGVQIVSQVAPNLGAVQATGDLASNESYPCCISNGATSQCTVIPDYTAVLFHMDQASGSSVIDNTTRGVNGACGTGSSSSFSPANCLWAAGKTGNAVDTAGNVYVRMTNLDVDLSTGPKKNSVEFWMYWRGTSSQMPFGWNSCYNLYLSGTFFGINTGSSNVEGIGNNAFLVNSWHHIVAIFPNGVTVNNDTAELWIDGTRQDIIHQTGSLGSSSASSNAVISGYYTAAATNYRFNGLIDEFAIYSRQLSPTQIQQHYQKGVARFYNQCSVDSISCPLGQFNQGTGKCA